MSNAKLKAPEGATSVSFDGESYEVKDGIVEVPHEAVAELFSHGYTLHSTQDKTDVEIESEKLAAEANEKAAKEEADRLAKEEADRLAKEEADKKAASNKPKK
jgi:hypothetical protein